VDLEEVANRERIVNVISYNSLLYIYYPAKFLFRKVMGGMGDIRSLYIFEYDLRYFC